MMKQVLIRRWVPIEQYLGSPAIEDSSFFLSISKVCSMKRSFLRKDWLSTMEEGLSERQT